MTRNNAPISWEDFKNSSQDFKNIFFNEHGKIYDCIASSQFDREFLDKIYLLTNKIRKVSKTKEGAIELQQLLAHKRAMLYFMQPSTRTYLSFKTACQILGIRTSDVRDSRTSSEVKGESPDDTIRTFSSYFDIIIMRHPEEGMAERAAWSLNQTERPVPVINAGSGKDQHPTQALLDIYTLRRSFEDVGGLGGKTIMMAGDLLRGRTVRSLSLLLRHFEGCNIIFSSPEKFRMKSDILDVLKESGVNFSETNEFHKHLPEVDAIYMTRIQDEHDNEGFQSKSSYEEFSINPEDMDKLQEHCVILHPLPRREEISPEIDNDPRAVYWRQERNGMWTRAALLALILEVDDQINAM